MNETGWITIEELTDLINKEIKEKKISARDGEYILFIAQKFADNNGRKERNMYKTPEWKFGPKW